MKMTKTWTRVLSLLLMLTMLLSVLPGAIVAGADDTLDQTINSSKTGSIKVTKYATTVDVSKIEGVPGTATGTENDKVDVSDMKDSAGNLIYTPLAGAKFTLYRVADENYVVQYYKGLTGQEKVPTFADFYQETDDAAEIKFHSADSEGNITIGDWTTAVAFPEGKGNTETDANGELTFSPLPVGFYVLVETTPPEQVVTKAQTTLISLPMVNTFGTTNATTNNSGWLYDINVYPKNDARKSTVTLTKVNGSEKIGNVSFTLYMQDLNEQLEFTSEADAWTKVETKATDNDINGTAYGMVSFSDLTAGTYGTQYMLIEESAPNGFIADRTPMYFFVDRDKIIHWNDENKNIFVQGTPSVDSETNTKLSITLNNERPSLEKKVLENGVEKESATETDWLDDSEYRLDDTLTYRLKVHIPLDVADLETFTITDAPNEGIVDHISTVTMGSLTKCAGETHADYCVAESSNGFTLTLHTSSDEVTALKGTDVYVYYTAEMNGDAQIDNEGNENKATLTYSTRTTRPDTDPEKDAENPEEIPTYAINDYTRVVTFHFDLTKYLDNETGKKPNGVQFHLFDETGAQIHFVGENGVYRLAVNSDDSSTEILETKDGEITINGLENGSYKLKEIQTVDGYNLLSDQFPITVDCEEKTVWTVEGNAVAWGENSKEVKVHDSTDITEKENSATIINKAGFILPQTGSMGYLLFCAAGLLLIGGGAALIFSDRKKVIR